ncbi:MFS transporter [Branchiibius hedensis]|uniref:Major Facilitator Superfamily protein n=1 Tax=Branchiibius hedensis TaxID=672460 RepID=A0A2Y9BPK3_9MICO|nr:MFS transporter [Branchiibius hedensis]PWJ23024.1 MFS transporter [Branchiibius hedensis]SSA59100.1 Major Facilitator Superfamily protein [Branchiibius hedensis]
MAEQAGTWRQVDRAGSYLAALGADTASTYLVYFGLAWIAASASSQVWVAPVVLGLETVPKMLLGLFGGALADRWGVWRTGRYTLAARVVLAAAAVPVFALLAGSGQIVALMLLALVLGLLDAIHEPALDAAAGLMAPRDDEQTSLTGMAGVVMQTAEVLAGPVVGLLIAWWVGGPAAVAVGLVFVALVLFGRVSKGRPEERDSSEGLWSDAIAGLGVARSVGLMPILGLLTVANSAATAPLVGALPVIARTHHWTAETFGFVAVAFALGAIGGAYLATLLKDWPMPRKTLAALVALIPAAGSLALFSVAGTPVLVFIAAAVMGVACQFAGRLLFAQIRSRSPRRFLGRVMGLTQAAVYVGIPIGYGAYAALAAVFSPPVAGVTLAVVLMLFALFCLSRPRLWAATPDAGLGGVDEPDPSNVEAQQ